MKDMTMRIDRRVLEKQLLHMLQALEESLNYRTYNSKGDWEFTSKFYKAILQAAESNRRVQYGREYSEIQPNEAKFPVAMAAGLGYWVEMRGYKLQRMYPMIEPDMIAAIAEMQNKIDKAEEDYESAIQKAEYEFEAVWSKTEPAEDDWGE